MTGIKPGDVCVNDPSMDAYRTRRIWSQILASAVIDLQFFSLGAALGFATVEIGGLSSKDDIIQTSERDLSWIGSICFITQASGNLFGGPFAQWVGRKKSMILSNVPYILAWVLMWQAQDLPTLLVGNAFLGFGTGLLGAPMTAYIGEICQPAMRGLMASSAEVFVSVGMCGVFVLGTFLPWRSAAVVYLGVAIFSTLVVFLIPESPIWHLSQKRPEDALKSLCWVRGWVDAPLVQKEFEDLIEYNKKNYRCRKCELTGNDKSCPHKNRSTWIRLKIRLAEFKRREAVRPLLLSSLFFIFGSMTSLTAIKPTMINLLAIFKVPLDPQWTMAVIGAITVVGALLCMSLVKFTGKRPMALTCMFGSFLTTLGLAIYAHIHIPPEKSSFEEVTNDPGEFSIFPLILFFAMVFFNHVGIVPISWMIISEIFPYITRGVACGFVGAVCDFSSFIIAKTYLDVETSMHIYGALYFYAAITFVGLIYLYLFLIETEGRSQADIEASFADKNKLIHANDWFGRNLARLLGQKMKTSEKIHDPEESEALNQKY